VKPTKTVLECSENLNDSGGGSSRYQLLKTLAQDCVSNDGDEDEDEDGGSETISPNDMYKLPNSIENLKTREELSSEMKQLPSVS